MLVKEYQESMDKKNFIIYNEDNIREITTFVKHITPSGNIRYAADIGHDDTVMTLVNSSSVFSRYDFREMVEDYSTKIVDSSILSHWREILKRSEFKEGTDYASIININKQRKFLKQMKDSNSNKNWFGF